MQGVGPNLDQAIILMGTYNREVNVLPASGVLPAGDKETLESDECTTLETEAKHEVQNTVDALKTKSKDKQK